jgi:hypothetical protein
MVTTKIYLEGKGYLDTYSDIQIPLNFSLAEVSDISKRNSSFSKTIILPGSKNNNRLLGEIFEINLNFLDADFNINRKIEAIIYQDDTPVLSGYFKLLKVNKISPSDISFDENIEYEAVVFSNQAGIFDVIKDNDIADIDLSQYNHILSFSAITSTTLNNFTQGYKYIHHYTSDSLYKVSDFRPAFFVKNIWDKIFEDGGYTYTSTFLNSEPFTKLLIPTNVKDLLISDEEVLKRSMRVSFSSGYSVNNINTFTKLSNIATQANTGGAFLNSPTNLMSTFTGFFFNPSQMVQLKFNDESTGINFDGDYDNYDTSSFYFTAPKTGSYEIELNLAGTFNVTIDEDVYIQLPNLIANPRTYNDNGKPAFDIVASFEFLSGGTWIPVNTAQKYYELTTVDKTVVFPTFTIVAPGLNSGTTSYNYTFIPEKFIVNLNQGWLFRIRFKVITYSTIVYAVAGNPKPSKRLTYNFTINSYNTSNSYWKVNAVKNNLSTGDEIVLNDLIPKNIKQADFIKSIVNMYNLFLIPDDENEKNIIIKTRDEFYQDYENQYVDWTDKFDYSQEYSLTLLSELQNKTLNYTYKPSNDDVNKRYREQTGFEYGQYKLNFDNDFLSGERKIELIFEPTPLVKTLLRLGDEGETFIVPYLVYGKETAPKLLYDGGAITVSDYTIQDVDSSGNTINYTLNYYNYAGHFDNPITPTFDLNWNVNQLYFYNEVLDNVTLNNLYNLYWFNYVNLIAQSKMLTGYFNLNEYDIANLNFAKLIWIRDSYYILNRVIDYDATSNGLTKVELIKAINSPKFNRGEITSIPPIFTETQTTNPIRNVRGSEFIQNVTLGNFENQNWGYVSQIYGNNNNILTYVKYSTINGDGNTIGTSSENVDIKGNSNFIGGNSSSIYVLGNNNQLDGGNENISLINCQNIRILSGIKNVNITNMSNIKIDESNVTYTSKFQFAKDGYTLNAPDIIDGGLDISIQTKSELTFNVNLIDAGEDTVYELLEDVDLINGIIDGVQINYEKDLN